MKLPHSPLGQKRSEGLFFGGEITYFGGKLGKDSASFTRTHNKMFKKHRAILANYKDDDSLNVARANVQRQRAGCCRTHRTHRTVYEKRCLYSFQNEGDAKMMYRFSYNTGRGFAGNA